MSHSKKPLDSLTDHLRNSLSCNEELETNKPDSRQLDLMGSPISPLRTTRHISTSTSSSSSSSGSVSGRNLTYLGPNRPHSGELSGSAESSPKSRDLKSGHVTSPAVLPTGNICPSGKILKSCITTTNKSNKGEMLGSGTARHYGHGSIMRGGAGVGASAGAVNSRNRETVKRRILESDWEELKRMGNENYNKGNFVEALNLYDKAIAISPGNAALHCNRAAALMGLSQLMEAVKECEEALRLDPSYVRARQRLGSLLIR